MQKCSKIYAVTIHIPINLDSTVNILTYLIYHIYTNLFSFVVLIYIFLLMNEVEH